MNSRNLKSGEKKAYVVWYAHVGFRPEQGGKFERLAESHEQALKSVLNFLYKKKETHQKATTINAIVIEKETYAIREYPNYEW